MAGSIASMSYRDSRVGQQQTLRVLSNASDTPAQQRVRQNLDGASLGWTNLPKPKKSLWVAFGAKQRRKDPVTGRTYGLTGREAYIGLNSRFALINPGVALPTDPPTVRFGGDTVTFDLTVSGNTVGFASSAANRTGVKTEILSQRLASADRAPTKDDYVSEFFFEFTAAGQDMTSNFAPGTWSFAYRFVSSTTGEASPMIVLGEVTVALAVVAGGADDALAKAA